VQAKISKNIQVEAVEMDNGFWPLAFGGVYLIVTLIIIAVGIRVGIILWCYNVGKRKGQGPLGIALGVLLGWIGLIIIYVIAEDSKSASQSGTTTGSAQVVSTCSHCSREIPAGARFCPHCGHQQN
jgi:predicted membrane channel-forming protein YqfA (hemolysin III family)